MTNIKKTIYKYEVDVPWCDMPVLIKIYEDNSLEIFYPHNNGGYGSKKEYSNYMNFLGKQLDPNSSEYSYDFEEATYCIREHFKLKPAASRSCIAFIRAGWAPPKDFNFDNYEWPANMNDLLERLKGLK